MLVVIQCAARIRADAGYLRSRDGRRVLFVAEPSVAPASDEFFHARPDDLSDTGRSWRDEAIHYNADPRGNLLGLLPAARLYSHPIYAQLEKKVGPERLFILSAGRGLLPGNFLTPNYDITFSAQAEPYKHRRRADVYHDFLAPAADLEEPMIYFGGKHYLPLFVRLTDAHKGPKAVFFNSIHRPCAPGCQVERFVTATRTNWHYECAAAWMRCL